MSLADPAFESNVIALLKGIYDNVGGGLPYTSIHGAFRIDGSGELLSDILSNNSDYTVNVIGVSINHVIISTNFSSDSKYIAFFTSLSSDLTNVISQDITAIGSTNLYCKQPDGSPDCRGFGCLNGVYVHFEIRFYPEP
jgi:hypothetical protein